MPSGDSGREYVERDDYPDADLSDAVFHFLSGEASADAGEDAACLAAGISDRGQHSGYLSFVWFDPLLAQGP